MESMQTPDAHIQQQPDVRSQAGYKPYVEVDTKPLQNVDMMDIEALQNKRD